MTPIDSGITSINSPAGNFIFSHCTHQLVPDMSTSWYKPVNGLAWQSMSGWLIAIVTGVCSIE